MVTPCFGADCANVEHAMHESYARAAVIAYWRHMPTQERHERIRVVMRAPVKAVAEVCFGATDFVTRVQPADKEQYLGIRVLYAKLEHVRNSRGESVGWSLALMEMLTDPMLRQWVPEWVVEQYERGNPFSGRC